MTKKTCLTCWRYQRKACMSRYKIPPAIRDINVEWPQGLNKVLQAVLRTIAEQCPCYAQEKPDNANQAQSCLPRLPSSSSSRQSNQMLSQLRQREGSSH